jgi:hypothetical protein
VSAQLWLVVLIVALVGVVGWALWMESKKPPYDDEGDEL